MNCASTNDHPAGGRAILASVLCALGLIGCNGWSNANISTTGAAAIACPSVRSSEPIPLRHSLAGSTVTMTFDELKARIDDRCQACHLQMRTGSFQYSDSYDSASSTLPGLAEAAQKMDDMILGGKMPPNDPTPEETRLLGLELKAWIEAGKPNGSFQSPASAADAMIAGAGRGLPSDVAETLTNLGSCIPDPTAMARIVEPDANKDAFFASASELPANLADTDFGTLDALALAKHGVFAYAPTYPLWSDDARKLRMVRVPKGQKITFDPATKTFVIPPNTRFYKTFFKEVVEPDGHHGNRAIETRLIVSRPSANGVEQALFGTYLWDERESKATLWSGPYRDGTPFRDSLFTYNDWYYNCQVDSSGKVLTKTDGSAQCDAHQRTYAIPARHRCIQCHEGAEGQNFILGFTPLQINRRRQGEGGVLGPVGEDELSQVDRLRAYGVLGIDDAQSLPALETAAGDRMPRNHYELEAQAYMVGNCAHCHNPRGFPVRDDPRLMDFNLSPGGIVFQFPIPKMPVSSKLARYVDPLNVNLSSAGASLIYRRVATPVTSVWSDPLNTIHVVVPHMPANTPGMDCRAPDLIGRWIVSIPVTPRGDPLDATASDADRQAASAAADWRAQAFSSSCTPPNDVINFVPEDLTEPKEYVPRRSDWNTWDPQEDGIDPFVHGDQIHGIPKIFRDLQVDEQFATISQTAVPDGFWTWKSICKFPGDLEPSPSDPADHTFYRRPWMLTPGGQPRRPLGEIFFETPGTGIFKAICSNCHGAGADGNSGNAKALLQLSDGSIRVANLMQGLFGPQGDSSRAIGSNLAAFDQPALNGLSMGPYGAAKYLVWMTSGGTTVKFPDGFETLLGSGDKKFGGNMLTKVSYYCSRLLPSQFWVGELAGDEFQSGIPVEKRELWNLFCGFRNQPIPDASNIPPDFDAERWLRTAQFNGGLMMYFFFRDRASHGNFPPNADQCERLYGP